MAVKFIKTIIISKANGKAKEVSFPVDEGFLKAISTLSEEEQASYLTSAYYDYKREQKRKRRILSFFRVYAGRQHRVPGWTCR